MKNIMDKTPDIREALVKEEVVTRSKMLMY